MSEYILGISCYYHDASATLLKNGNIAAAADEERFTRIKHDISFPVNAIRYCLRQENITSRDISYIGFYEKPILKFERVLYQHLETYPLSLKTFIKAMPSWIREKLRIVNTIKKILKYAGNIFFIKHHMSHAASAFLPSPFDEAAILTVDGVGEWTTTAYGLGRANDISIYKEIKFPHSLGLLYSTITAYLGFRVNDSEYEVMGLSAYGNMDKNTNVYYKKLRTIVDIKKDGSFRFDLSYFKYHYSDRMPSIKMCSLLGGASRKFIEQISDRHRDIAAAVQLIYEEIFLAILREVHDKTRVDNIVISGGCGLNSVANGKILENTSFKDIWIPPHCSDGGSSMGVALYIDNVILKNNRRYKFEDPYLGPAYSPDAITRLLDGAGIMYKKIDSKEELLKVAASLIYQNKIIGWVQGRMEWGPRALGNRSILANPSDPCAKDILNKKIKKREEFRPFAPSVLKDKVPYYFECNFPLPLPTEYMLMVYQIKKECQKEIPSVTHVDGSGRLQAVDRDKNLLFYDLIKEFEKISGIPMIINTSFNGHGEPIVCNPVEAYNCMMKAELDYLVIENILIKAGDNLQVKNISSDYFD